MKYNRFTSTAVLFLLLGTTLPAFAQKGEEEKSGGGGKPQAAQHEQKAQHAKQAKQEPQRGQEKQQKQEPQRAQERQQKQQPQRAQERQQKQEPQRSQGRQQRQQPQRGEQAQRPSRQQTETLANNRGGHYGRISDANYRSHFGHEHSFHMGRPQMIGGYNRFQYGGYSFGYNQGWPVGWGYNDDCYVAFEGGAYFMYDLRHPGVHITLSLF
jgi:DNA mismatch repair ATPase MutL